MSEITSEVWHELDEAEKEYAAALAERKTRLVESTQRYDMAMWRIDGLMRGHRRALIDAARPKGIDLMSDLKDSLRHPCLDCSGTGWAK